MEQIAWVSGRYRPLAKGAFLNTLRELKTLIKEIQRINVYVQDDTIKVIDRYGNQSVIDIAMQSEKINVTITTKEPSVKVAGIKLSVYINGGKTPQYYTTDLEGKVSFTVPRGNYYQIEFPEYAKAQPISPIGYTAILSNRDINITYLPYDEATSEKVIIKVNKVKDGTKTAWADKEVNITIDKKTTSYTTDANGQYIIWIPLGKEYTIQVADSDGYYVGFSRNTRTFTAKVVQRQVVFNAGIYLAGIFLVNNQNEQYNIDDWKKLGYTGDDVVGIRISTDILMANNATYVIPMKVLLEHSSKRYQWCDQNVLFESISSNGNSTSDPYYYNGEGASELIRTEAQQRALLVPAFTYAYSQIFEINGEQYHGYIGSIAQWDACIINMVYIRDNIITELWDATTAATIYEYIMNIQRWTSTQRNSEKAYIRFSVRDSFPKSASLFVVPFYTV